MAQTVRPHWTGRTILIQPLAAVASDLHAKLLASNKPSVQLSARDRNQPAGYLRGQPRQRQRRQAQEQPIRRFKNLCATADEMASTLQRKTPL